MAYHLVHKQRTVAVHACVPDLHTLKSHSSIDLSQIRHWHAVFLLNTGHGMQASSALICWLYVSHKKTNYMRSQDKV